MDTCIFDRIEEIQQKIDDFYRHRKKIKALDTYSLSAPFEHRSFLGLLKLCLKDRFLKKKEADFLDYMISEYEQKQMGNYLFWTHKTRGLKKEIAKLARDCQTFAPSPASQLYFDFDKPKKAEVHIPINLLIQQTNNNHKAI
jgi:hypothetical protein